MPSDEPTKRGEPSNADADDKIDARFDQNRECLTLNCSATAFARIRNAVLREAASALPEDNAERVSTIEIVDLSQFSADVDRGWRDRIGLFACALFCFVILMVLLAGVLQIVTWMI